jgi:PleD family two-component response regulator
MRKVSVSVALFVSVIGAGGAAAGQDAKSNAGLDSLKQFSQSLESLVLLEIALFLAVGIVTAKLTLNAQRMRQLAMTDDLTGLHNLRSFEARLVTMMRTSRESQAPLALLVADVDRLKSLNDEFGHLTGAEAVRTVGHIIGRQLPPDAVACRYGGDEFVIAIPKCTAFVAHQVADDLRRAVQ